MILEVFLVVAALAIAVMVWLANYRPHEPLPQGAVTAAGYRVRRFWFWLVLAVAVAVFGLTIPHFPYPYARASSYPAEHVKVVAQQYSFSILPPALPLNHPIVFDVTAKDVNHGFGIYAPDGRVFSQVQAMPDYVNHLPLTFTEPGHYTIRCLEYCGIGHAGMQGGFDVR